MILTVMTVMTSKYSLVCSPKKKKATVEPTSAATSTLYQCPVYCTCPWMHRCRPKSCRSIERPIKMDLFSIQNKTPVGLRSCNWSKHNLYFKYEKERIWGKFEGDNIQSQVKSCNKVFNTVRNLTPHSKLLMAPKSKKVNKSVETNHIWYPNFIMKLKLHKKTRTSQWPTYSWCGTGQVLCLCSDLSNHIA